MLNTIDLRRFLSDGLEMSYDDVLDRIYEAALVPETWPDLLSSIAQGSHFGGILYAVTPQTDKTGEMLLGSTRWLACEKVAPYCQMFVRDGWLTNNLRAKRSIAYASHDFITDLDICTIEEIEKLSYYRYLRESDMGWHCGLTVQAPTGDVIIFNFERRWSDGPASPQAIAYLNAIKGHLSRAALFAARLGLDRARGSVEALRIIGLPAAVLSAGGSCIASNDLFDRLHPNIFTQRASGQLSLKNVRADIVFRQTLEVLQLRDHLGGREHTLSLPLPGTNSTPAAILHFLPIRRSAKDIFSSASCALIVTALRTKSTPSIKVLQGLFDFTNAEAHVAKGIAAGSSVQEIADSNGKSIGTVRQQLKIIFQKAGVRRQAELVALLSGTGILKTNNFDSAASGSCLHRAQSS